MPDRSDDRPLYSDRDNGREHEIDSGASSLEPEAYRSGTRRDYARLIHSTCFRRLAGKTQLFPNGESDYFRTRLTHSLEVAQVAKSIAVRLNNTDAHFAAETSKINPEIVEVAALAHDIGHPPFGHNGEEALDRKMIDSGGFEGNAQTLRLLTRIEKKYDRGLDIDGNSATDDRVGLNLTYRVLSAVLKYDVEIPRRERDRDDKSKPQKGYYHSEAELVARIKSAVLPEGVTTTKFKTIECSIMDVADDIAYSTYDIEDSFKAGFTTPLSILATDRELLESIADSVTGGISKTYGDSHDHVTSNDVQEILIEIFGGILGLSGSELTELGNEARPEAVRRAFPVVKAFRWSRKISENGYYRNEFTSRLVGTFIRGVEVVENPDCPDVPQLLNARLNLDTYKKVEILKRLAYENLINSSRLKVAEYRGQQIIEEIFEALKGPGGTLLLPDDYRTLFDRLSASEDKDRAICDFIAGMTDKYALEFYSRLKSADPSSIFKPI